MTIRQTVCYTLFWSKVLLSLSACTLAWGYIIEKAFTLHKIAQFTSKWTPRYIPHIGDCTAETNIGMARLEPPDGFMYVGFHIDWKINGDGTMPRDTVPLFGGRKASIFNAFYTMNAANENSFDKKTMMWHAHATAEQGALMEITMEPVVDPNTISDAILIDFADTLADINLKLGVPVLLRWGHEMNGDWTTYGGRPLAFKSSFKRLTLFVRQRTNITAMLWSPNYGAEYPFTDKFGNVSTSYPTRISNPAEFAALDTNGNGILDKGDDPYLPYYPGDDLVDWVGLSLYHYPDAYTNTLPKPNQVLNSIHGSDGPSRPLHNFYDRFAQMRQKPFIFSETGAPISPFAHNSGPGELLIKQTWWKQVSSLVKSHGLYKGFVNFEERKSEDIETNEIKDWKVITSSNQSVVSAFREDFKEYDAYTLFANEMSIKCNGAVTLLE